MESGMWTCPICGLKGDYGLEQGEDNFCPLCQYPEKHTKRYTEEDIKTFKAIASLFEDDTVKLTEKWYGFLWDGILQRVGKDGPKSIIHFIFKGEA